MPTIPQPALMSSPLQAPIEHKRTPPHNLEMEKALLAALMSIAESYERIEEVVQESHFYANRHKLIFRAIKHLAQTNMPYDAVLVHEWLEKQHLSNEAGGEDYLGRLLSDSPATLFNLEAYAKKVREFATLRDLIAAGNDMLSLAYDPKNLQISDILGEVEANIFRISEAHSKNFLGKGPQNIGEVLPVVVEKMAELSNSEGKVIGLSTSFTELDNKTLGMHAGDMIVVAARPSMGKTTFAMNLAESVLFQNKPVVVFSMEMPAEQIAMRMISSWGAINQTNLRSGNMNSEEWSNFTGAVTYLQDRPLYIDDSTALPPSEMRSRCRRIAKQHGGEIGLVVVDYLQLMTIPGMDANNRVGMISEISRSLKGLARELNCPVVALSQLNRSLENRPNKRPIMSDLRESGAIEQDADVITFIYRDEVYNKESKHKGIAEIIIGKQRNGPIGTINLAFEGQFLRFRDVSPEFYQGLDDLDDIE